MSYNKFADLPRYKDVRNTLRKHAWKRYPVNGIARKTEIAIHHSLTETGSAEAFANYHVDTHDWPGIAYAFVIEQNGDIKHCNDLGLRTYHVGISNDFAVGVCLVGDFRYHKPTDAQKESLRILHARLVSALPNYVRTRGHNEYPGYAWKECPCFDYMSVINSKGESDLPAVQGEARVIVSSGKESEGYIIDGRVYVPIRFISDSLGASIAWNNQTKVAHVSAKEET